MPAVPEGAQQAVYSLFLREIDVLLRRFTVWRNQTFTPMFAPSSVNCLNHSAERFSLSGVSREIWK